MSDEPETPEQIAAREAHEAKIAEKRAELEAQAERSLSSRYRLGGPRPK